MTLFLLVLALILHMNHGLDAGCQTQMRILILILDRNSILDTGCRMPDTGQTGLVGEGYRPNDMIRMVKLPKECAGNFGSRGGTF